MHGLGDAGGEQNQGPKREEHNASVGVKTLKEKDTCDTSSENKRDKLDDIKWISGIAEARMERNLPCEEKHIMDKIKKGHGFSVDYNRAWEARNLALKELGLIEDTLVDIKWISGIAMARMKRDLPCEEKDIMDGIKKCCGLSVDYNRAWKARNLALKKSGLIEDDREDKKVEEKKKEEDIMAPMRSHRTCDTSSENKRDKLVDIKWISGIAEARMERSLPCEEKHIMDEIKKGHGFSVDYNRAWKARNLALKELGLIEDTLIDIKWISGIAKAQMERNLPCEEKDIMDEIKKSYGISVDYNRAWKARNLALKESGLIEEKKEPKKEVEMKMTIPYVYSMPMNGPTVPAPPPRPDLDIYNDVCKLQREVSDIRDSLEEFRRIVLILLIVIMLFLLTHFQTNKR